MALRVADAPEAETKDLRNHPGFGIEGTVDGMRLRIGAERFCAELAGPLPAGLGAGFAALETRVFLAAERGWIAAFDFADAPRPRAQAVVARLQALGKTVHLCSGDAPDVVTALALGLGIGNFRGLMAPQHKLAYVRALQRAGRVVAMVGDGLNDAPVLAGADVSLAMAGGADAAQLGADAVLLGDSLDRIPLLMETAKRVMRLVKQNLAWALAYNAAALPLAAAGWIGPWEAALGMGASSLIVLLNALRPIAPPAPWKASTSLFPSPSPSFY
jgi:Cu2+-exporting ATPase